MNKYTQEPRRVDRAKIISLQMMPKYYVGYFIIDAE